MTDQEVALLAKDLELDSRGTSGYHHRCRHQLAKEFGERTGWRITSKSFTLGQLSKRSFKARQDYTQFDTSTFVDHPSFYINGGGGWGARPAGIAVHLYDYPLRPTPKELTQLSINLGIRAYEVTTFPSWHWPGQTRLIVYSADTANKAAIKVDSSMIDKNSREPLLLRTKLFVKEDDGTTRIETRAGDENQFVSDASACLIEFLMKKPETEPATVARWLRQIADIVGKYRGYKTEVAENRVFIAGQNWSEVRVNPDVAVDEKGIAKMMDII